MSDKVNKAAVSRYFLWGDQSDLRQSLHDIAEVRSLRDATREARGYVRDYNDASVLVFQMVPVKRVFMPKDGGPIVVEDIT